MKNYLVLLVFVVGIIAPSKCSLPIEKPCGDVECPQHFFCSPIDHSCRPCDVICGRNGSNYDHERCVAGCQDYIHDTFYVRRNDSFLNMIDYVRREDVDSIKHLLYIVIVSTALTLILVLLALSYFIYKFFYSHSKMKRKQKTIALPIIYDNKYGKEKESMENNANNNKRSSVTLEREPSESTLPEYAGSYAYDNPNMSHSPSHHV